MSDILSSISKNLKNQASTLYRAGQGDSIRKTNDALTLYSG